MLKLNGKLPYKLPSFKALAHQIDFCLIVNISVTSAWLLSTKNPHIILRKDSSQEIHLQKKLDVFLTPEGTGSLAWILGIGDPGGGRFSIRWTFMGWYWGRRRSGGWMWVKVDGAGKKDASSV